MFHHTWGPFGALFHTPHSLVRGSGKFDIQHAPLHQRCVSWRYTASFYSNKSYLYIYILYIYTYTPSWPWLFNLRHGDRALSVARCAQGRRSEASRRPGDSTQQVLRSSLRDGQTVGWLFLVLGHPKFGNHPTAIPVLVNEERWPIDAHNDALPMLLPNGHFIALRSPNPFVRPPSFQI